MTVAGLDIREALPGEHEGLGRILVDVYANLDGFPSRDEQPGYYEMLQDIGRFNARMDAKVLVAVSAEGGLLGGVVYFGDMAHYGSGGSAPAVRDASGIRLLGVAANARGMGVGRALTDACIRLARDNGHEQVILHTTQAMRVAWDLYLRMGFERSEDLDFMQQDLPVFGFRLRLK